VSPVLLQAGWRLLAKPTDDEAQEPVVEQTETMVTVKLAGVAKEVDGGPGRWSWHQTWTLERTGRLRLAYILTQTVAPRGHGACIVWNGSAIVTSCLSPARIRISTRRASDTHPHARRPGGGAVVRR